MLSNLFVHSHDDDEGCDRAAYRPHNQSRSIKRHHWLVSAINSAELANVAMASPP